MPEHHFRALSFPDANYTLSCCARCLNSAEDRAQSEWQAPNSVPSHGSRAISAWLAVAETDAVDSGRMHAMHQTHRETERCIGASATLVNPSQYLY